MHAVLITDGAIFAALAAFRIIAPDTFGRVFRAAVILAGIAGEVAALEARAAGEPSRLRRVGLKLAAMPGIVRAAVKPHPDALPAPCRAMIAAGAVVPIIGPVDEAGAVVVVAGCAIVPELRRRIVAAWDQSIKPEGITA